MEGMNTCSSVSFWLFILIQLFAVIKLTYASKEERELIRQLVGAHSDYETLERPIMNQSMALAVNLGINLQQIVNVDEINQNIIINLWLNMKWRDEHMIWNKEDHGNIGTVFIPPKYLWRPDVILYNSVNENFDTTFPTNMVVSSDGSINWLPPSIITATCKIDITWFPFDDQICKLKFGSWTYNGFLINLTAGDVDLSTYTESGEWYLRDVTPIRTEFKYTCCPEPYLDVTFHIHLGRRTLYFGFNLIIPCILISVMTLLDFLLPVDSGEKLGLGITIFMSLIVFLLMIAEALPPTSDAVPIIGIYFSTTMVVVSLSQVFTVVVLNFFHRTPVTYSMAPWMRRVFLEFLPWVLMMHRPGYRFYRGACVKLDDGEDDSPCEVVPEGIRDVWKRNQKSRSTVWIEQSEQNGTRNLNGDVAHMTPKDYEKLGCDVTRPAVPCLTDSLLILLPEIRQLSSDLKIITKKMKDDDEESEVINDWKFISQVIDRMCFWVFSVLLICTTVGIIFSAPRIL